MTDTVYAWSQTAADNATADATINWAEFQNPSTVNDSARALMSRVAKLISDLAPKRSSTGSANAYAVTGDAAGTTLRNGEIICFIPNHTNTGPCTLNVGGRGAVAWRPAPGVDFSASNILSGVPVTACYRSSSNEWLSEGTGYYVTNIASGVALQSITARLPQIGDMVVSLDSSPGAGRIRLTESTQSILKSAWPELNSWLSARSYPWGSTATHFSLPPAAGYFLRFAATSSSIDTSGARTAGSTQSDQNKAHAHPFSATTTSGGAHPHDVKYNVATVSAFGGGNTIVTGLASGGLSTGTAAAASAGTHDHSVSGTTDQNGGDEVRVKNIAFHIDIIASTALAAAQVAVFGFPFQWDTSTTAADPGSGRIRANNATLASATALYIDNVDGWGVDLTSFYATLTSNTRIVLSKVGAQSSRLIFTLSSVPTVNSGYHTLSGTVVSAAGTFSANDNLALETSGSTGAAGPIGATGPNTGLDFAFNTATSGDPGSGKILYNNATPASVTQVNISKTGRNSENLGTLIGAQDDSTNTAHRGHLRVFSVADRTKFIEVEFSGTFTDNTTYWSIPISSVSASGSLPANNDVLAVLFERTGNKGADGAGSGDVVGPGSATDNTLPRFDGTTGKLIQASGLACDDSNNVTGLNTLKVGAGSVTLSDPTIVLARAIDDSVAGNGRGTADNSAITRTGSIGYASFDAGPTFSGTAGYNHYVGLQVRPTYSTSGTISNLYGYYNAPDVTAGTVTNNYGAYLTNPSGAGNITNNYGLYISGQTKGGTLNWSLYAAGSSASYFGGNIEFGHETDTTLSRASAGVLAVEGETVHTNSTSRTLTAAGIELGHATDTTITRTGAGAIAVEGVGVALNSTSLAHTAGTIEIGHASDTTLSRASAGVLAVEGQSVLTTGTTQTLTKGFTVTPYNIGTVSSGTTTPAPADGNYQYMTNNGAHTLAAPSSDCAIDILVTNGASAGAVTFSGFTAPSGGGGDTYATTNTNKYLLMIRRINGTSTYAWKSLQ